MKKFFLILNLVTVLAILNAGATERPKHLSDKIDSLVSLQHSEGQPGGVIAILSGEEVMLTKSYGLMDIEQNKPNDLNTTFDIASVAKQFTAFAIMLLEEEGKLELDKDIRVYLPYLPEYGYKITVRNLLQHTSGIASTDVLRLFAGLSFDELWNQQKEIELIGQYSHLNFKPNTSHVYSNSGYALLAQIVEEVSGMNFPDYLENKIFIPAGMKSAVVYSNPALELVNNSIGYKMVEGKPVKVSSTTDYSYGSSNIYMNLSDMICWGQNFISPKAGNAAMIKRILNPYNTLENGDSIFYTYGFNVRKYKGVKMVEHSGGVPGFRNQFMIFPDDNLIIILMFNNESINTRRLANGIADILLSDKIVEEISKPRIAVEYDPEKILRFAGNYQLEDGMELSFEVKRDTFWLVLPDASRFQLFAENEYKFFLKAFDAQCTFVPAQNGEVNNMLWHQGGADYKAIRAGNKVLLSAEELARFAGNYYQKELRVEYPLTCENGKLSLSTPPTFLNYLGFDTVELNHISGDKFLTDKFGVLEFTRDENNHVNGFVLLDVGRVQNLRFSLVSE